MIYTQDPFRKLSFLQKTVRYTKVSCSSHLDARVKGLSPITQAHAFGDGPSEMDVDFGAICPKSCNYKYCCEMLPCVRNLEEPCGRSVIHLVDHGHTVASVEK